eukprot:12254993-Prorocentrum_lima.AAC.1
MHSKSPEMTIHHPCLSGSSMHIIIIFNLQPVPGRSCWTADGGGKPTILSPHIAANYVLYRA